MDSKLSSLRILILEDQLFQRLVAEQVVAGLNIQLLLTAETSEDALKQLQEKGPVDLVLCDLDLPGMDGIEFIRHLANQKLADGVIVLSAMDASIIRTVEDMSQALGLKSLGHLPKPIHRNHLREMLEIYVNGETFDSFKPLLPSEQLLNEKELEEAVEQHQFILHYQPKVLLNDGQLIAVEALVRWQHPDLGLIHPVHFIPMMESSGMIEPLTINMIDLALIQIKAWQKQGRKIPISINISATMLSNTSLPDMLMKKTRGMNIPPALLNLEITESSSISDVALALETLARFKLHGFALSIDDFGTGYASMQQLNRIPFSELKIDQSFVSNACNDDTHKAIVESNIHLAHRLNMQTVGEGVETQEDWQMLHDLNCDIAQGYFIARPMPADALLGWEKQWLSKQPITPHKPAL
ncbi:GGDEF/EAL domain-containing response regulator [Endozoicomonas ascidiicola]|uniref:GGDEF/EAL domain-containing response regulator n=1 Tax=Endozoicomonas ascidiicola TaxID=1698521 RepID=UPI00082A9ABE|nr:EAL domain-containing response regulator [Endozoicomonas ascidiicola]